MANVILDRVPNFLDVIFYNYHSSKYLTTQIQEHN